MFDAELDMFFDENAYDWDWLDNVANVEDELDDGSVKCVVELDVDGSNGGNKG